MTIVENTEITESVKTPKTPKKLKFKYKENIKFKYKEDKIIDMFFDHIKKTYSQHYDANELQAFDAWMALGDDSSSFRDTAIKYLWRYGKKNGNNKEDLMKAFHYILMMMYMDHYKIKK